MDFQGRSDAVEHVWMDAKVAGTPSILSIETSIRVAEIMMVIPYNGQLF